jgi:hypothetical protein
MELAPFSRVTPRHQGDRHPPATSRGPLHQQRHPDQHLHGLTRTGEHAEWLGMGIYTVTDGKISEGWFGEDILGMLIQLGAFPPPDRRWRRGSPAGGEHGDPALPGEAA